MQPIISSSRINHNQIIQKADAKQFSQYMLTQLNLKSTQKSLYIFQGVQYSKNINNKILIYVSGKKQLPSWIHQIGHLENCLKIKIYPNSNNNILISQAPQKTLQKYLTNGIYDIGFLSQQEVIQIFTDIFRSYSEIKQLSNSIYGNLSTHSIAYQNFRWKIDLIPGILQMYYDDERYYPFAQKNQRSEIYAFGILLFRCLFGFFPQNKKKEQVFNLNTYLTSMDNSNSQSCTKIYRFLKTKTNLSEQAKNLLEKTLSYRENFNYQHLIKHPFFESKNRKINQINKSGNDQVKMLSEIDHKNLSKVLAAIQNYKKYNTKIINKQHIKSNTVTEGQILKYIRQDFYLSKFVIPGNKIIISTQQSIKQSRLLASSPKKPQQEIIVSSKFQIKYFYRNMQEQSIDLANQYPCRQLIKQLNIDRQNYGQNPQRYYKILIYAYPYAIALELLKYFPKVPSNIVQKIQIAVELLLQVSNLNYDQSIKPQIPIYHPRTKPEENFQSLKPRYRQVLNQLYKYFLNNAIQNYNSAKKQLSSNPNSQNAKNMKQEGLYSYRLCWKLLQASLIVRKQGKDLDLMYMETSQRKQIQVALNGLLGKYFPNKIY